MRHRGTKVGIAQTAKNLKHRVIRHLVIEAIGDVIVDGCRGIAVEENNSSG